MKNFTSKQQIIIAVILGIVAISVFKNVYQMTQDPFPELTNQIKETQKNNEELQKLMRKAYEN